MLETKNSSPYQIWTDGACSKNPGEGGWAFVIHQQQEKGKIQEIHKSGYSDHTTNNIMEMTAAIKALENLPLDSSVTLYTDSQYLQKGIEQWIKNWKKKNWRTTNNKPVANQELWKKLDQQNNLRKVQWVWVKGHAANLENKRCDKLARLAIKEKNGIL